MQVGVIGMIVIDGSYGEGGGQLLRYSVALASLMGIDVRVVNIRAKRSPPGLRPQHLAAVRTIAQLVGANVEGLFIGSMEIVVKPRGRPRGGKLEVDIGTAGSVSLLLQAALPVLAAATDMVALRVRGGTDVSWSPPINYFEHVLIPLLRKFGLRVELKVVRRGFYPQGGGIVDVNVFPSYPLKPVEIERAGELREIRGISYAANLPRHVAERQAASARDALRLAGFGDYLSEIVIDVETPAVGPGSGIVLWAEYENGVVGADALGEKGKRAEVVGREAAEKLISVLRSGAPIDAHALDNIVIYMALAKGRSVVVSNELSSHAETAIWLCEQLTRTKFTVLQEKGGVKVAAEGVGYRASA